MKCVKKDKKKQHHNQLEAMIFAIMQKSLKAALDEAIDDLFREWK